MSIIGVDIGGTKIEAIRYGEGIEQSARVSTKADQRSEIIISQLYDAIDHVRTDSVTGIGIGFPGFVNDKGEILFCHNVPTLVGQYLAKTVQEKYDLPVVVDNDANCFAMAEYAVGAAKGSKKMLGIIIGTGVGAGVILNGKPYGGTTGAGGEVGHMRNADGSRWEDLLAGPGISALYKEKTGDEKDVAQIWTEDSQAAQEVRNTVISRTGIFLANMINTFNPDCIVLGGGVSNLPYYDEIRREAKKYCIPTTFEACEIKKHEISDSSGVIGAAMLVR